MLELEEKKFYWDILLRKNLKTIKSSFRSKIKTRLSYKERRVDALALGAEEGRDKLR